MIRIQSYFFITDALDGKNLYLAVTVLSLNLHAFLNLGSILKLLFADFEHQRIIVFPVSLFWFDGYGQFLALLFSFECIFQPRNDVSASKNKGERLPLLRGIQDLTGIIFQGIVDAYNLIILNFHISPLVIFCINKLFNSNCWRLLVVRMDLKKRYQWSPIKLLKFIPNGKGGS